MSKASVTVGLPVFNGAQYLPQALDSLLGQDYPEFELIISDNGSTDATQEICQNRARGDQRIRYHRVETNKGLTWNFNRVFALGQGRFFRWAAHDDLCDQTMLRRCVETMESSGQDVCLVYPRSDIIDMEGRHVKPFVSRLDASSFSPRSRLQSVLQNLSLVNPLYGLFRTDVLRQTRGFQAYPSSDFVFMAEAALQGRFLEVPEVLFHRRLHEDNSVRSHPSQRELFEFYDPRLKGTSIFLSVNQRLLWEFFRLISRHPMPLRDKLSCWACATERFMIRHWRNRVGAWRRGKAMARGGSVLKAR